MRIQYKFKINGRIKPDQIFPLKAGEKKYSFELCNGIIEKIVISLPLKKSNFPQTNSNPSSEVALEIIQNEPAIERAALQQEMRQFEGLMSIFGCESIDTQYPEIEWIAETDEEQAQLQLYSISSKPEPVKDEEIEPLSFDLIARPILAAAKHQQELPALSFFRKARNDMRSNR